jgi:hypothetical protein
MKSLLFDLVQLLNQMLNSGILNAVLSGLFRKWLLVLGGMLFDREKVHLSSRAILKLWFLLDL